MEEDNKTEAKIETSETQVSEGKTLRDVLESKLEATTDKEQSTKITSIQEPQKQEIKTTQLIAPPADMKPEEKEAFSKLPPEMQSYLSRRSYEYQSDHTRKVASLKQYEQEYQELGRVVTPEIRQTYAREGISLPNIVERAIAWDREFKSNPNKLSVARDYLESYGIYPEDLLGEDTQEQPQYLTRQEAEQLALEQAQKLFSEQQQSQLAFSNYETVQSFISEKPLFKDPQTASQLEEAIAEEIIGLRAAYEAKGITYSPKQLLDTAYERVTKIHPVFSNLIQEQSRRQEAERQHQEALKARVASRSIKGSPGQGTPTMKSGSIRESLERNLGR